MKRQRSPAARCRRRPDCSVNPSPQSIELTSVHEAGILGCPQERRPHLQSEATRLSGTDLTLDLPSSVAPDGVGELAIAATLYAPGEVDEQALRVLVCWPGGSYGRDYWDIHLPGRDGYSFAEHMTARGFVVIAADPLGVGDSGRPEDGTLCTYDALADAAHGAVKLVRARLADGTLVEHLPPIAAA